MHVFAMLLTMLVAFVTPTAPREHHAVAAARPPLSASQRHVVQHLDGALRLLEQREVSALSVEQRRNRAAAIVALKAYRDAGQFPLNRDHPGEYVPYFIDPE